MLFLFRYKNVIHRKRKGIFYVCLNNAFVREFTKMHQLQCRFGHGTKSSKRKAVCPGQKELNNHQYQKRESKTCEILHEIPYL